MKNVYKFFLSECKRAESQHHLVWKWTTNDLATWMSFGWRTWWLYTQVLLQSLSFQLFYQFREKNSLTFRKLESVNLRQNTYVAQWKDTVKDILFYDARWLLQLLQLLRDFFILLRKSILEKEKALHFYADVIFCLFISLILLSSSCFLLSDFNKNVKETKFFEKNSCGLCCF